MDSAVLEEAEDDDDDGSDDISQALRCGNAKILKVLRFFLEIINIFKKLSTKINFPKELYLFLQIFKSLRCSRNYNKFDLYFQFWDLQEIYIFSIFPDTQFHNLGQADLVAEVGSEIDKNEDLNQQLEVLNEPDGCAPLDPEELDTFRK